jgi:hypothetical protein
MLSAVNGCGFSLAKRCLHLTCTSLLPRCLQVHKLEAALSWHLQQGALQDASVLQLLVMLAAKDGNVAVLSLLLPLFEKMGWLVSFKRHTQQHPWSSN